MQREHAELPDQPVAAKVPDGPMLAIIIDDVGHGYAQGRRLVDLPVPVALAILPGTRFASRLAQEADAAGQTVMLHLPMENLAGLPIGPGGLYQRMSRAEFDTSLEASLEAFTPIHGVNNHMGSLLTTLRPQMDWLMQALVQRGLFFVDSRTTTETQAAFAASAVSVPHASRDVFLDNSREPQAIHRAFQRGLDLARRDGSALLIGHPHAETLDYLERWLPGLQTREGITVVSVQQLLQHRARN